MSLPGDGVGDRFSPCRNSVRLIIRKIQFAPMKTGPAPKSETTRQFMMSDKPLHLEASLDKEVSVGGHPMACATLCVPRDGVRAARSCNRASSHCRSTTTESPST